MCTYMHTYSVRVCTRELMLTFVFVKPLYFFFVVVVACFSFKYASLHKHNKKLRDFIS